MDKDNDKTRNPETTGNKIARGILTGAKNLWSYIVRSPRLLLLLLLTGGGITALKTCQSTEPTVKKTTTTLWELLPMTDRTQDMHVGDKTFHITKDIVIDQNKKIWVGDFSISLGDFDDEARKITIEAESEFWFKFDVIKNKSISTTDSIDENQNITHRIISLSGIDHIDTLKVILTNKTSVEETEKRYQWLDILEDKEKTKAIIDSTVDNSKSDIYKQFLNDLQRNPTEYINMSMKTFWVWLVESRKLTDSKEPKITTLQVDFVIGDNIYTAQTADWMNINIISTQHIIRQIKN